MKCAKATTCATFHTMCHPDVEKREQEDTFAKGFDDSGRMKKEEWSPGKESLADIQIRIGDSSTSVGERNAANVADEQFVLRVKCADTDLKFELNSAQWSDLPHQHSISMLATSIMSILELMIDQTIHRKPDKWYPDRAIPGDVKGVIAKWERQNVKRPPPLGCVCGPAVLWAAGANILVWVGYPMFWWFANGLCECDPGNGLARYKPTLWLFFAFFFLLLVAIETNCCRYILYPVCQVAGPPKWPILGRWRLSFNAWVCFMIFFSAVSHMDIASNGFFLATTLATRRCPSSGPLDEIWERVMKESFFFGWLSEQGFPSFSTVSIIFWSLGFLQPIYALLVAVPRSCSVTYKPAIQEGTAKVANEYRTCLDSRQNHGAALMSIAEVARMPSVTYMNKTYALAKFEHNMRTQQATNNVEGVLNGLHHAQHLLSQNVYRTIGMGFLESSFQLNLQISLLALSRAAQGPPMREHSDLGFKVLFSGSLNLEVLASIVLSFLMAAKRLWDIWDYFTSAKLIREQTKGCKIKGSELRNVVKAYIDITVVWVWGSVGAILFVLSLIYAVIKFWAIFNCQSGLYNLWVPGSSSGGGCVNLTET